MSYAPRTLLDLRTYLKPFTGLSDNELGIVGDTAHNGGYHCGRDRLVSNDYSNRLPRDQAGLTNAASASDIGKFARTVDMNAFLVAQGRSGATNMIREINGLAEGGRAYKWDSLNSWRPILLPKGDSHESHTHISWFRDTELEDKRPLFRLFFEGIQGEDDMFCKMGDKGDKVVYAQLMIRNAGSDPGAIDGDYGPMTAAALAHLTGEDGSFWGPWQMNFVQSLAFKSPAGPPGVPGPAGPPGKTPAAVELDLSGIRVRVPVTESS